MLSHYGNGDFPAFVPRFHGEAEMGHLLGQQCPGILGVVEPMVAEGSHVGNRRLGSAATGTLRRAR